MKYLTPSARTETFVQVDTIRPFSSLSFYSQYSSLIRPFSSLSFYTHYSSPTPPVPSPPSPSILITHPSSVPSFSLSFYTHYSSLIRPFFLPLLLCSLLIPHLALLPPSPSIRITHPSSVPSSSLSFYTHYSSLILALLPPSPSMLIAHPSSVLFPPILLHLFLIRSFSSLSSYTHPSSVPSFILILHPFLLLPPLLYFSFINSFSFISFFIHYCPFLSYCTRSSNLPSPSFPPILIYHPYHSLLLLLFSSLIRPFSSSYSSFFRSFSILYLPLYSSFKFISVLFINFLLSFFYEYSFTPSSIHSFIFISLSTFLPFFNRSFFPHIPPPCF